MTTRSRQPSTGVYVDAPAIHRERLSPQQIAGHSCCWCGATPDPQYPVPILHGATLLACDPCASMYGVPAVDADR
ncbi:hypothetical protein AB0O07_31885 [Streptomyces sp. NPDC093085]|uniref:hypothetical protein n=1 Tax=Streptomyces sp. NPDC093085 TaxID=3155068 RepID=UPI0034445519